MGQANHLGFSIEQATMKINTTAIGIFILVCCSLILVCCSLVLSQPKAPQSPNASMFPCPGNYLYVPASYLIANRTDYAMPIYPPIAVQAKIQGDVVLKVLIDDRGNVKGFEPKKGNPILIAAAAEAVSKWKFKPDPDQKGVEGLVPLTFSLEGGSPLVKDTGPPELVDLLEASLRVEKLCMAGPAMAGYLLHRVDPDYPATAKAGHIQGDVVIEALIDKSGNIVGAKVVKGHPMLVGAALEAVKQWRYSPYKIGGEPVEVETFITVRFHM